MNINNPKLIFHISGEYIRKDGRVQNIGRTGGKSILSYESVILNTKYRINTCCNTVFNFVSSFDNGIVFQNSSVISNEIPKFTLCFWVKCNCEAALQTVSPFITSRVSTRNNGNIFVFQYRAGFGFDLYNDTAAVRLISSSHILKDKWEFVTITHNPSETTVRHFVENIKYTSEIWAGLPIKNIEIPWEIGIDYHGVQAMNGQIGEIMLYSSDISPFELNQIFINSKNKYGV